MKISKFIDKIDIIIDYTQQIYQKLFSFDFKNNNENKNLNLNFINNTHFFFTTILFTNIIHTNTNYNEFVKQLYDFYLKSKNTKIVKYQKMTSINFKSKEIYADC